MNYPKRKFHIIIIKTKKEVINTCSICYEETNLQNQLSTSCNHIFCISCTKEYMINTPKQHNLECPYCRQIIVNIKMSNQEEINLMRKHFCKLTQTIHFMEPNPIQENYHPTYNNYHYNYPHALPPDIYLINNYLQEFLLEEDNIVQYNVLFGWICITILILYVIIYSCNIIFRVVIIYHEEYYQLR